MSDTPNTPRPDDPPAPPQNLSAIEPAAPAPIPPAPGGKKQKQKNKHKHKDDALKTEGHKPDVPLTPEAKEEEPNALASALMRTWESIKSGQFFGKKFFAIMLIVIVGIGLWWYIASGTSELTSQQWVGFNGASTEGQLKELADGDPNESVTIAAKYNLASYRLDRGLNQIASTNPAATQDAKREGKENLVAARDELLALKDQFPEDPVRRIACLWGLAKAEAALVGIPAGEQPPTGNGPIGLGTETLGSVDKVIEYLQPIADEYPETPWGKKAASLLETLNSNRDNFVTTQQALIRTVQPSLPGVGNPAIPGLPQPGFGQPSPGLPFGP